MHINRGVTIGADRWLALEVYGTATDCLKTVRKQGFRLYAADPDPSGTRLEDLDFSQPAALIVGEEHSGISEELLNAADARYRIEMFGFSQSFNVSVAAALSLYIASRRRREAIQSMGDLTAEQQQHILDAWVQRQRDRTMRKMGV